jgi:putative DeoR family transcriptional regulator (stage III sporulation protein D)
MMGVVILKEYMEERIANIADYIIDTKATVREAAVVFKISKSTVHKDMSERLTELNPQKAAIVQKIMQNNKDERHIRGGLATHNKYKNCIL